jgi:hypothetical protein
MSIPMIRRVLAGLALAAVLAAVPAQAAGLERTAGAPDLWSLAWSWMARLWGGADPGSSTPRPSTAVTTEKQLPGGSGSTTTNNGDSTDPNGGDKGMGIDPDG